MASRLELQTLLEELLGSTDVYYQPPESIKINYPAIVYNKSKIVSTFADNIAYLKKKRYDITVIDKRPDNGVIDKLLDIPHCSFDRHYTFDNLNHDTFTIFY